MKHIILLIVLLSTLHCTAQKGIDCYDCIHSSDKTVIFFDDFEVDEGKWVPKHNANKSTDTTMIIADGSFVFSLYDTTIDGSNSGYLSKQKFDLDEKNFEVEFRIKTVLLDRYRYYMEYPFALISWGVDDNAKAGQETMIHGADHAHFMWSQGDDSVYWRININADANKQDRYNVYTFRRYKNHYYLFLNGIYTEKLPYKPLRGHLLYIGGYYKTFVKVDYIKVSYLPGEIEIR